MIIGKYRSVLSFLFGMFISISAIDILGFLQLRSSLTMRLVSIDLLDNESMSDIGINFPNRSLLNRKRFQSLVKQKGIVTQESLAYIIQVSKLIDEAISGNKQYKPGMIYQIPENEEELFSPDLNGKQLYCGHMCDILQEALVLQGFKVRQIQLFKSCFSLYDTHVVLEVLLNDQWIIIDPTFNVTYQSYGKPLGVQEIQHQLKSDFQSVQAVPYDEQNLIDTNYLDWRFYFNNALIWNHKSKLGILGKIPPFRWWFGPKGYYWGDGLLLSAKGYNDMYFILCVVLPISGAICFLLICVVGVASNRQPQDGKC